MWAVHREACGQCGVGAGAAGTPPAPPGSPPGRRRRAGIRRGRAGFPLVELVVSATVLALMATTVLGGLLYGMTEARRGKLRAEAAAWVQAELDYLRVQGYSFLADDAAPRARTLTQSGGYTTYGDLAEPRIPAGADRAR